MHTTHDARTRLARRAGRVVSALALVVGLAACSDDGGAGVASLSGAEAGNGDASPGGSGEAAIDVEREEATLAFTRCMREHGVDVPDAQDGRITVSVDAGSGLEPDDSDDLDAAHEACRQHLEGVSGPARDISPEEQAEMRDRMLEFAQCMRDNGVDMPDPTFDDGGGAAVMIGGGDGDAARAPGAWEAAQEACDHIMADSLIGSHRVEAGR